MAVRALITKVNEPEIVGDNLVVSWRHLFYGKPEVPTWDAGLGSVTITPAMTVTQVKTAIKNAIQADATALGYGTLQRVPQHIDEVFHNL